MRVEYFAGRSIRKINHVYCINEITTETIEMDMRNFCLKGNDGAQTDLI